MSSQSTYKPNTFSSQNKPKNTPVFHSSFTGKEKDTETGYYYFGARYYNSDYSIWLSVDPMADKYPSMSPYNYCAWNPMKLVDPDGDSIILSGSRRAVESVLNQMNSNSQSLDFSIDAKGRVICDGHPITAKERYMKKICNDDKINVSLNCLEHNQINEKYGISQGGGSFLGNLLSADGQTVDCFQVVNANRIEYYSNLVNSPGGLIWHEISEAYEGGRIALKTGISSPHSLAKGTSYSQAHWNAGRFFPGSIVKIVSKESTQISLPSLGTAILPFCSKTLRYNPIIGYELHRGKPSGPLYR